MIMTHARGYKMVLIHNVPVIALGLGSALVGHFEYSTIWQVV